MSRTTSRTALLAALVAFAALAGAVPAGATADSASFHDRTVTVTRGNAVSIGVSHSARANLTIGSEQSGFEVVVPLGGGGSDKITLDTYETGGNNDAGAFISGSGATLTTQRLEHAIEPGVYEMRVTIDGTTQAVGQLEVLPRRNTTGSVGVAPGAIDPGEAGAGGVLARTTNRGTVARGDYTVFTVNESGLGSAFNPENLKGGEKAGGIDAELVALDTPPNEAQSTDSSEEITVVSHASTAGDDVRVLSQVEKHDRFLVVWDTSDVPLDSGSNHTYEFRLSLTTANNLVEERTHLVTQRVQVVEPSVELTADPGFELSPWDGATMRVSGTTNLAPTTVLDVRARQGKPNPFLWKHTPTVSANGTFGTMFDFAAADRPTSVPLWVLGHREQSEETVTLGVANASLVFDDQRASAGTVTIRRVVLSHGGFVRVTQDAVPGSVGNTTVGASAYLGPGSHENVSVALEGTVGETYNLTAVAFADANRDGALNSTDAPYNRSGSTVSDNATVRPAADSQPNTTAPSTSTQSSSTQRTVDIQDEPPLTPVANQMNGGSSGGSVPLSLFTTLAAFAAAALLAGRR
ncbi:DUF7282 domain-containing protein [Halobacterium zhouii]|uniref:DUF7282 domain-containing protein n=1 Tax=Halobacterium zhouii TaxID=2902624 RepID=UPI001E53BC40|nr:BGTF surface domain-containing protein [Halobacterium zhouii]